MNSICGGKICKCVRHPAVCAGAYIKGQIARWSVTKKGKNDRKIISIQVD